MTEQNQKPADEGHSTLEELAGEYQPAGGQGGPAPGGQQVSAAEWSALFHAVFGIAAIRLGPHWVLQDEEADQLGQRFDAVADRRGWNVEAGPEIGLALTALTVAAPRVMLTVAQNRAAQDEETEKNQQGASDAEKR